MCKSDKRGTSAIRQTLCDHNTHFCLMMSQAPYRTYIWLSSDPQKHVALKGDLQYSTTVGRGSACPLWVLARLPTSDTQPKPTLCDKHNNPVLGLFWDDCGRYWGVCRKCYTDVWWGADTGSRHCFYGAGYKFRV